MNCIITAGPTYEPLDQVRRLTNLSTGRLGSELADYLSAQGHHVILLRGSSATYSREPLNAELIPFSSTADLRERLRSLALRPVDTVFHAAAVSDFGFGRIFERLPSGELVPVVAGKIPTGPKALLAELVPTPKIIPELRTWYPSARLIGWKYEVDGTRQAAISAGISQIRRCKTDACVVNGPAYGEGFGLVREESNCVHLSDSRALFPLLEQIGNPRS